jgi:hypothetical protein
MLPDVLASIARDHVLADQVVRPPRRRILWVLLFREVDTHPGMKLEWVRGHATDRYNNEVDIPARTTAERIRDGKPVANQPHLFITQTVTKLEGYIAKFQALAEVGVEEEIESAFKLMGAKTDRWFLAPHPRLGEPPIDLVLRGERQRVWSLLRDEAEK